MTLRLRAGLFAISLVLSFTSAAWPQGLVATPAAAPEQPAVVNAPEPTPEAPPAEPAAPANPEGAAPAEEAVAVPEADAAAALAAAGGGATAPDWQSRAAVQLTAPQDFATGSFRYNVPIAVPPFRGLEPSIVLNYQSGQPLQYSGNGAGWMGIGWRLDGIPSIDRGLRGGGSPSFNTPYVDGGDVFMLGGEELVPCEPGMVSPSCAAGGTHATRVESYRRVSYSSGTNYWTVTDRDGTAWEFRPVVETQSVNPSDPVAVQLANNYRWLLRKITDTHGNQVTYAYTCSTTQTAYCRIDTITYSGAEVKFYWETRPDPYTYATGLTAITVGDRLKTIDVKFASNRVRTYALAYSTSAVVGLSVLATVQQYPLDASVSGSGVVTAGATAPLPATSFSYVGETSTLGASTLLAENAGIFGDFDGDGRTDYVRPTDAGPNQIIYANGTGRLISLFGTIGRTADFNGDGKDDIVSYDSSDNVLAIQYAPDFAFTTFPYSISGDVGDFNGDGRADFFSNYRDIVHLGNSDRTFTTIVTGLPLSITSILIDVNGDGKTDAITNTAAGGDELLISNGVIFTKYALSITLPASLKVADIDGDGRQDLFVCRNASGLDYYFSRGLSFSSVTNVSVAADQCAAGDFNGDGRSDIAVRTQSGGAFRVFYSKGTSLVNVVGPSLTGSLTGTADFNGDGRADVVSTLDVTTSPPVVEVYKRESTGTWPNLAYQVANVFGAVTQVAYTPSSAWAATAGSRLPFIIPTVTEVSVNDGNGVAAITTYSYRGGRTDAVERRFLGFSGLVATLPCNVEEELCPVVDIAFSQALAAVGSPIVVDQRSGDGISLRATTTTLVANDNTAPFTALATAVEVTTHDGAAFRTQRVERVYDAFGQVALERELGAVEFIGDERATWTVRFPNMADYVVDRIAETAIFAGTDVNGTLLARARALYDEATSFATAPTLGDATETQTWLNTTNGYVVTSATYDAAGNLLSETDPVGNVTTYDYDPTYALFQVQVTNPLLQETDTTWNITCAKPDTVTDPNGLAISTDYDAFCREIRQDLPGGDYRELLYVSIGTPTAQYIEVQRPAPAGEVWSREYADGLGRVYRTSARGPSSAAIETRTIYANRGTVSAETRPFFAGEQPYGVGYTTDALDRVVRSAIGAVTIPQRTTIFFTSGTSWTVPAEAQRAEVVFDLIGGGGGAGNGGRGGGGGGAYSQVTLDLRSIATVYFMVGAGGTAQSTTHGGDTWVNTLANSAPTTPGGVALAQGGRSTNSTTGGPGGAAASSFGDLLRSGGTGGTGGGSNNGGGGGGGAAGPDGIGANGGAASTWDAGAGGGAANGGAAGSTGNGQTGGLGGNNIFGVGGGASNGGAGSNGGGGGGGNGNLTGGNGSQQALWTQTSNSAVAGPGSGGGGGGGGTSSPSGAGGNPGSYGGGGGAGGDNLSTEGAGKNGAAGIIVVTYTPVPIPTPLSERTITYLTIGSGPGVDAAVVTDELGRVTTTTHDAYGRTIETVEQAEATYLATRAAWSLLGKIVGVEDTMGNRWSYTYDSLGRRVAANDPDLGAWTYAYDAAGQLALRIDALGQETAFSYDGLGRVLTQTTRVGEPDEEVTTNTYDEVRSGYFNIGQLTTAANDNATIAYDYDEGARLERQRWTAVGLSGTKTEETGYAVGGEVLWKNWPDGTTTGSSGTPWTYNNAGLLYGIPSLITQTLYNAAGQVTHIAYANGVETDNTYDVARGWMMEVDTSRLGTTLQSVTYTRDDAGRALTRVVAPNAESWTYTYDNLDRLLAAANASDGTSSRTYTYDDAGNMLTNSGVGTYTYPAPGQPRPHAVLTAGANTYAYDDVGNMLSGAGRTLTYDGDNRLVEVVTAAATTVYAYGPDGSRISTVVTPVSGPVETSFLLGGTEINPAGTYIKVPNPDVRIVGATVCWVHRDQLATILFETNSSGAIALRQRFQPYGERVSLAGGGCAPESRGFIGERLDGGTGLIDLNARWYDPVLGRFINADWWDPLDDKAAAEGGAIGVLASPVGTDRYAYAANDPVNRSDPSGHAAPAVGCVAGGMVAGPIGCGVGATVATVATVLVGGAVALWNWIHPATAVESSNVAVADDWGRDPGVEGAGLAIALSAARDPFHIVVGRGNGLNALSLEGFAALVRGSTLMNQAHWMDVFLAMVQDQRFRFTIQMNDIGFRDESIRQRLDEAIAVGNGLLTLDPRLEYYTEWEIAQLYNYGRIPDVMIWDDLTPVENPY